MNTPLHTVPKLSTYSRVIAVGLCLAFFSLSLFAAWQFGANGDEGQYLYQSRLFSERGLLPSIDFFASNPPLFFCLYGGFMKLFGYSFETARVLSVLLFFGTTVLTFRIAFLLSRHFQTSAVITVLLVLNWIFFRNNVIMKHYAPSNLLIMAAVFTLFRLTRDPSLSFRRGHFFFGLLMGLAFSVRIHLVVSLMPFLLLWALAFYRWRGGAWRDCLVNGMVSCAAFLLGALPMLGVLLFNPEGFYFNYYYYQFVLSPKSLNTVDSYWLVFPAFFWAGAAKQNLVMTLLAVASAIGIFRGEQDGMKRWSYSLLALMALAVCVLYSFSPVGLGAAHFSQSSPYWTLLTVPLVHHLLTHRRNKYWIMGSVVAGLCYVVLFSSVPVTRLMYVNNRYAPKYGSLGTINRLGDEVAQITRHEERILDWFGSASFLSGRQVIKGFEQFYAVSQMFNIIPDDGFQVPPMLSKRQLHDVIDNYGVDVVVSCERWCDETSMDKDTRTILHSRYRLYRDIYDNLIYVSPRRYEALRARN